MNVHIDVEFHAPVEISVSEIVYRKDLYPRFETNPVTVQQYANDIEVLPPILVNQHNELIDGWHRWTAYKKREIEKINGKGQSIERLIQLLQHGFIHSA